MPDTDTAQTASAKQAGHIAQHSKPQQTSSSWSKSYPGITFAAQDSLPKLPIPDLKATTERYLKALQPLQDIKAHHDTETAVREFLDSEGPALQDKLKDYAQGQTSYIEQFWYDSYLNYDNPVVLNLNPFFLLEDDPTPARNNQVTRAASLVVSALSFVRAVRKEELPPDAVRGQPLDMYQYSRLFATARIPTEHGCQIGQDTKSTHIVVLSHGQFYWFDVLDADNDLIMTEKDVSQNLQSIVDDAAQTPLHEAARGALGVLSTENRKIWSGLRDVLSQDEGSNNADCLDIIDTALFVLCLDYTEPLTVPDLCMNMLCGTSVIERGVQVGTCTNRWYDKLQIIVCKNGSAGINFEHTGVDGHTVLRFASDLYTDTILRFARTINGQAPSLWASTSPDPAKRDPASFGDVSTTPHKLEWDMGPELSTALRFAETRLADLIQQNEFATLEFGQYGKTFMTSMGFSPDAFVQMAFQAAYYGLYGRVECTYEPAMTKFYYHGRTEAIRSVTNESVEFVKTFWGENPLDAKIESLRKACQRHTDVTKDCAKANGQDRHLYALYCVWQRLLKDNTEAHQNQTMPALFADGGWETLNNTILSTSNCGNPCLRHFGFGPSSGDGFGIGYIIKDGSVSICASSKHRQTNRFVAAMESYFLEIRKLLRQSAQRQRQRGTSNAGLDKTVTRAREAESLNLGTDPAMKEAAGQASKPRGRKIGTPRGSRTPLQQDIDEESDDEGLGGYGFFDAGMLLNALKSSENAKNKVREQAGQFAARLADAAETATSATTAAATGTKKEIGKRLALSEY